MSELSDLKKREKKLRNLVTTEKDPFVKEFAQKELRKVSNQIERIGEGIGPKLDRLEAEKGTIEDIIQDVDLIKRAASKAAVRKLTQEDVIKIIVWSDDAVKKLRKLEEVV